MPYKALWYEKDTVAYTEMIGDFTVEEMIALNREYDEIYFLEGSSPIHLIADLRAISNYPKNLAQIRDATNRTALQPRLGWVILIGLDNPFVKFLSSTIFQLLGINSKIVGTLEEAEKILERVQTRDTSQTK